MPILLTLLVILFAVYIVWLTRGPLRPRSPGYNPPASRSHSKAAKVLKWYNAQYWLGVPNRF